MKKVAALIKEKHVPVASSGLSDKSVSVEQKTTWQGPLPPPEALQAFREAVPRSGVMGVIVFRVVIGIGQRTGAVSRSCVAPQPGPVSENPRRSLGIRLTAGNPCQP